jgi:hypothetical protein
MRYPPTATFQSPNPIPGSDVAKAHTSPVYVTVADKPVFVPSSAKRVLDSIPKEEQIMASDATNQEKTVAVEWAERARKILEERKQLAGM